MTGLLRVDDDGFWLHPIAGPERVRVAGLNSGIAGRLAGRRVTVYGVKWFAAGEDHPNRIEARSVEEARPVDRSKLMERIRLTRSASPDPPPPTPEPPPQDWQFKPDWRIRISPRGSIWTMNEPPISPREK